MNALTTTANTALAGADVANPFAAAGSGAGSTTYMKFKGASGDFLYGQDEDEMPYGTQFGADIENSEWVWSFWWEGEVLETVNVRVSQDPLAYENEPDRLPEDYDGDMSLEEIRAEQADRKSNFMDGWSCQAVLTMRLIGGKALEEDNELEFGEDFTIKLNQGVSLNAFRSLLNSFGRLYRLKQGLVPVVEISARSYVSKNKSVGKRYTPVLKIADWKSEEELLEMTGEDPDMYDDGNDGRDDAPVADAPKQVAATKEKAAPADDAKTDDAPAPRGRRGRAATNYA